MITVLVVPRQLPAAMGDFVGRAAELEALTCLLDRADGQRGGAVIMAIGGMAGVGKTGDARHSTGEWHLRPMLAG
jgi:hypothetical protein